MSELHEDQCEVSAVSDISGGAIASAAFCTFPQNNLYVSGSNQEQETVYATSVRTTVKPRAGSCCIVWNRCIME